MNLIDKISSQKVTRDLPSAHQPYIFSFFLPDRFHQALRALIDEDKAFALSARQRSGEDIVGDFRTLTCVRWRAHCFGYFITLAAHDGGIYTCEKLCHGEIFGHEKEVKGPVRAGNIAVQTNAKSENDVAHGGEL